MNFLGIINLCGTVQGFFFAYLLINRKGDQKESRYLALLVFIVSFSLLGPIMGITGYYRQFPHFIRVTEPMALLFGPLLFFYLSVLTTGRLPRWFGLHLIPFLAYVLVLAPFYMLSADEKIAFVDARVRNSSSSLWQQALRIVQLGAYLAACLYLMKQFERKLQSNFSSLEKFKLRQSGFLLKAFGGILVVGLCLYFVSLFVPLNFLIVNNVAALSICVVIYILAYVHWNQPHLEASQLVAANPAPVSADKERQRSSYSLTDEQLDKLSRKLDEALTSRQLFLSPDLSLADLSEEIGVPAYQVSEVINRHYRQSFFDQINLLRVEEIKKRLLDPAYSHYSILAIAMDCGFSSKSSFNNAFRKITGLTPSAFRKSAS